MGIILVFVDITHVGLVIGKSGVSNTSLCLVHSAVGEEMRIGVWRKGFAVRPYRAAIEVFALSSIRKVSQHFDHGISHIPLSNRWVSA